MMIITKTNILMFIWGIGFILITCSNASAAVIEDNFDSFSRETWRLSSKTPVPEIILTNTLSGVNHSIRLKPFHKTDYIVSSETFVDGSFSLDFKIDLLKKGEVFYYIGFHNTSPWGSNSSWLIIQNGYVKFQSRRQLGKKFTSKTLAVLQSGKMYNLKFKNDSKKIEILLNGKLIYTFSGPDNAVKEPMTFLAGANSPKGVEGPAVLTLDYVKVSGSDAKSLIQPRPILNAEKKILHKWKNSDFITVEDNKIYFKKESKTYLWDFNGGLHWGSFAGDGGTPGCDAAFVPCFAVGMMNGMIYSNQFELIDLQSSDAGSGIRISMRTFDRSLTAVLSGDLDKQGALVMGLKLHNISEADKTLSPIFPIVGNQPLGRDLGDIEYFFPWRSGLLGRIPAYLVAEYGNLAWMQVMFAYNTKKQKGVYVFPLDSTGGLKGLILSKRHKKNQDSITHVEVAIRREMPSIELPAKSLTMAYFYPKHKLHSGESCKLPNTIVNSYSGTWKEPLKAYGKWVHSWYKPVRVPRWFKDSYIFVNQHPPAYYSKEKKRYVGHNTLKGGEDVVQWAFWQDYIEQPADRRLSQMEKYQAGDFRYNQSRGGLAAFADEINRIQAQNTAFTVYINHRFCWVGSECAEKHGKIWGAMSSPGKYTSYLHPKDLYCMCFYDQDKWAGYLKDVCVRLVKDTRMKGVYLDELGFQMPCYNPLHEHYKQGRYPSDNVGIARSITMIRKAMNAVNPEAVLWTEHAGSDWLSQYFDGSWDQTFYVGAYPFAEKHFDQKRLCFFRFLFPEFKLAEWGSSKRHMERYFFNGMGWDLGGSRDQGKARVLAAILRENSDAVQTLAPEPLVSTSNSDLLANRFASPVKIIYTFYNRSDREITGYVLEKVPSNGHFIDLLNDEELNNKGSITLKAGAVNAVALFPRLINLRYHDGIVEVKLPSDTKGDLWAYPENDIVWEKTGHGKKILLTDGKALLNIKNNFGPRCEKIIFKMFRNRYLIDEAVLNAK